MNIESVHEYCMSLPHATEDMAFGDGYLLMRVFGKIFACISFERQDYFVLKCDPGYAVELRDRYADIEGAWHWNKKYWNQLRLSGSLGDDLVKSLIRHSYAEVVKKMPRKVVVQYPELVDVKA